MARARFTKRETIGLENGSFHTTPPKCGSNSHEAAFFYTAVAVTVILMLRQNVLITILNRKLHVVWENIHILNGIIVGENQLTYGFRECLSGPGLLFRTVVMLDGENIAMEPCSGNVNIFIFV